MCYLNSKKYSNSVMTFIMYFSYTTYKLQKKNLIKLNILKIYIICILCCVNNVRIIFWFTVNKYNHEHE